MEYKTFFIIFLFVILLLWFLFKALYWFGKAGADFGHAEPKIIAKKKKQKNI